MAVCVLCGRGFAPPPRGLHPLLCDQCYRGEPQAPVDASPEVRL